MSDAEELVRTYNEGYYAGQQKAIEEDLKIPLRDTFAAAALTGMAYHAGFQGAPWEKLAKAAYEAADFMLLERQKGTI